MTYTMYPKNAEPCGIVEFYDRLAELMYGKTYAHYDCTKVYVGKEIQDKIFNYYRTQGTEDSEISMLWVCYGPKATLEGYEVECENDWATDE